MNPTQAIRRAAGVLAGRASPPDTGQPHAGQLNTHRPRRARRPGRDGFAARVTQDIAAFTAMTADENLLDLGNATSRRRTLTVPRLLPRTIKLCIHCQQNPAGFWVSHDSGQTTRRPWCLTCCQDLDPHRYHLSRFDS
jgi:hypothetical protein